MLHPGSGGSVAGRAAFALHEWKDLTKTTPRSAELLVVTSAELRPALATFLAHKESIGVKTLAVTMDQISAQLSGADDAEKLKRLIYKACVGSTVRWVLLAGDARHVPTRYRAVDQEWREGLPITRNFNATDFYYANLYDDANSPSFATWAHANSEPGIYNRTIWGVPPWELNSDGVAGYPVVSVGRVPATNARELELYLLKVQRYELNRPTPGSLCIARSGFFDPTGNLSGLEAALSVLPAFREIDRLAMRFEDASMAIPVGWRSASNADVFRSFSNRQWLVYYGHGSRAEWWRHFSASSFGPTSNIRRFPIVVAAACETATPAANLPWDLVESAVRYRAISGKIHQFSNPQDPDDGSVVLSPIQDLEPEPPIYVGPVVRTHQRPVNIPAPTCYDEFSPGSGRSSLASRMLFATTPDGSPTGAVAYIGQSVGLQGQPALNFFTSILSNYARDTSRTLGDVWLAAQKEYFADNFNQLRVNSGYDPNFAHPRVYLSIAHMFGDPSLRL